MDFRESSSKVIFIFLGVSGSVRMDDMSHQEGILEEVESEYSTSG